MKHVTSVERARVWVCVCLCVVCVTILQGLNDANCGDHEAGSTDVTSKVEVHRLADYVQVIEDAAHNSPEVGSALRTMRATVQGRYGILPAHNHAERCSV